MFHLDVSGASTMVDWFNLGDATNVVRIIGFLIPLVTALVTKSVAAPGLKSVVTTVLSAITAALAVLVAPDGHAFAWQSFINAFINAFVVAIASYHGLWKPTGVAGSLANATRLFGFNGIAQTRSKGVESAGDARNPAATPRAVLDDHGYITPGLGLVLLGIVLMLVSFFVVGMHILFVIGIILIIVGVILMIVGPNRL